MVYVQSTFRFWTIAGCIEIYCRIDWKPKTYQMLSHMIECWNLLNAPKASKAGQLQLKSMEARIGFHRYQPNIQQTPSAWKRCQLQTCCYFILIFRSMPIRCVVFNIAHVRATSPSGWVWVFECVLPSYTVAQTLHKRREKRQRTESIYPVCIHGEYSIFHANRLVYACCILACG